MERRRKVHYVGSVRPECLATFALYGLAGPVCVSLLADRRFPRVNEPQLGSKASCG